MGRSAGNVVYDALNDSQSREALEVLMSAPVAGAGAQVRARVRARADVEVDA